MDVIMVRWHRVPIFNNPCTDVPNSKEQKEKKTTTMKTWRGRRDEDDGKENKMSDNDNIDKDDVAVLTK